MSIKKILLCLLFYFQLSAVITQPVFFNKTVTESIIKINGVEGLLCLPTTKLPRAICIIVPGSGPTDKDGNNKFGLKANSYKILSDSLLKNGVSVFRYDKRGVNNSIDSSVKEKDITINTYVNDLSAIINFFSKEKRFKKIYLLGHSEGSLIAILSAQKNKIDGLISIAGAGKSADTLIIEQLQSQPDSIKNEISYIISQIKIGKIVTPKSPLTNIIFRPSVQPYLKSWFQYSPTIEISKLNIPILIVQGSNDLQIKPEHGILLSTANKHAQYLQIKNMNHVLKVSTGDIATNLKTYTEPNLPITKELADAVSNFINTIK